MAYPVINLKHFKLGMRSYVRTLEEVVIKTCQHFGVKAGVTEDTGIWVKNKKICALGKSLGLNYYGIPVSRRGLAKKIRTQEVL